MHKRVQIIATIGPASQERSVLEAMIEAGLDMVRFNFAWLVTDEERRARIALVRSLAEETGRQIPCIADLPGPRRQMATGHTYDQNVSRLTPEDKASIEWCAQMHIEYIALSFVGSVQDIEAARAVVTACGGNQKIIAKIERKIAVDAAAAIIAQADAIMIARGDLGLEIPLEDMPFVQQKLTEQANQANKPVIVATGLLASMVSAAEPARAEVTDVAEAVMHGADALLLSNETAVGAHPVEAILALRRISEGAFDHMQARATHQL